MNEKRLKEINERKEAIREELKTADEEQLRSLEQETDLLLEEEKALRSKSDLNGKLQFQAKPEGRAQSDMERRGRELKQSRAVTIGSGTLIKPMGNQTSINDELGQGVSSIIDMVKVTNCMGMSEYQVAYKSADMTAAKNAENTAATSSDPTFAYAVIKPVTITTYSEISREARNLTDVDYYSAVLASARKALRRKVSEFIIKSDATSSAAFIGVNSASAISAATDIEISAIDDKTLRNIVLNYGGDEDTLGGAVLFLNKTDLIAFGDVRGTNEKKAVYEITPDSINTNTGIIRDGGLAVRYCLNSNITSLSQTAAGAYSMFYGVPECYELGLFSDYTVRVSEDYQFAKRMLAVLGEVMIGGNVTVANGFVRVKTPASKG
ncbi:MAG: phage major capsid protein [Selenomonadales bacterium]|jgi:HK97 family phage major capsid protein|nr:phage major capsid protein [Clostridiales bacterium]PWL98896.1 MAG: phage major capsid protein [Selenomonadales bacterium]DAU21614.1 MAG TPA: major capsid protein [Caudoviricetes sp.]